MLLISLLLKYLFVAGDDTFHIEKLIGSGAFAKVYLANKRGDTDEDDFENDDESAVVLKVQVPVHFFPLMKLFYCCLIYIRLYTTISIL